MYIYQNILYQCDGLIHAAPQRLRAHVFRLITRPPPLKFSCRGLKRLRWYLKSAESDCWNIDLLMSPEISAC